MQACLEKLIKRLEKEETTSRRDEEDGQPYSDVPPKTIKGRSHVFKVRGAPCADWFECDEIPSSARSTELEIALRNARHELRQAQELQNAKPIQLPLAWVSPESRGKDWNVICLQLG